MLLAENEMIEIKIGLKEEEFISVLNTMKTEYKDDKEKIKKIDNLIELYNDSTPIEKEMMRLINPLTIIENSNEKNPDGYNISFLYSIKLNDKYRHKFELMTKKIFEFIE